jgi:UDP-sugar diphosphatase
MSSPLNWTVEALPDNSRYVQPRRIRFEYKGRKRVWDICLCPFDSVCAVVYHKEKDSLIFAQQFRPAVYNNALRDHKETEDPPERSAGFIHECCAGLCDKNKSLEQIMQEEVLEELGFNAPVESFEKITEYRNSVGVLGYLTTLFYVEVTDSMKVSEGGGIGSEDIQLVYVPVKDLEEYLLNHKVAQTAGVQLAILWFLRNKVDKVKNA